MPVVINEFEVVAEAEQQAPRSNGSQPAGESTPPRPLDAFAVAAGLRTLERQTLRVWAH